jgi:hypothetical protein
LIKQIAFREIVKADVRKSHGQCRLPTASLLVIPQRTLHRPATALELARNRYHPQSLRTKRADPCYRRTFGPHHLKRQLVDHRLPIRRCERLVQETPRVLRTLVRGAALGHAKRCATSFDLPRKRLWVSQLSKGRLFFFDPYLTYVLEGFRAIFEVQKNWGVDAYLSRFIAARHARNLPIPKPIERDVFHDCVHRNDRVPKQSEVPRVVGELVVIGFDYVAKKFSGIHREAPLSYFYSLWQPSPAELQPAARPTTSTPNRRPAGGSPIALLPERPHHRAAAALQPLRNRNHPHTLRPQFSDPFHGRTT